MYWCHEGARWDSRIVPDHVLMPVRWYNEVLMPDERYPRWRWDTMMMLDGWEDAIRWEIHHDDTPMRIVGQIWYTKYIGGYRLTIEKLRGQIGCCIDGIMPMRCWNGMYWTPEWDDYGVKHMRIMGRRSWMRHDEVVESCSQLENIPDGVMLILLDGWMVE